MSMICNKPKHSCGSCAHYRYDEDSMAKSCWLKYDCLSLIGKEILIINMKDEPQYKGRVGRVTSIDDLGYIHGTWGGCSLVPTLDEYIICKIGGEDK